MNQTRGNQSKKPIPKKQIFIIVLAAIVILLFSFIALGGWFKNSGNHSVTENTSQTTEEVSASSSVSQESTKTVASTVSKLAESSEEVSASSSISQESAENIQSETTEDAKYPKITKEALNGKSWYQGASTGIENQPRTGFHESKYRDNFGNVLDYEIILENQEQKYRVLDFRSNEVVDINLKTKIKVNSPSVDGTYRDVYYYLYYKYDGTLMITQEGVPSEESDLVSYPLQDIDIWSTSE